MIVTIDDYRGATDANAGPCTSEPPKEDDSKFTVASAGHLKLKLQALNHAFRRTPLDQHSQLRFDDILQGASPRTYINGSEEVYFLVKSLPWPSKIPEVFTKAYSEVVQLRPFTNTYIPRQFKKVLPEYFSSVSARFAPTFSSIRPLLPELDALCNTTLSDFFQKADEKVKPFAFMHLPTELRLQVYDYLVPAQAFIRMYSQEHPKLDKRLPVHLEIMRVSKVLHEETTKQFFNKTTLFIEACKEPGGHQTRGSFTKRTAGEYVALITSMSPEVKCRFTRLEIQILPESASTPDDPHLHDQPVISPLRQVCAALPNLESVLVSYPKINERTLTVRGMTRRREIYADRRSTLDWIRAQLPERGLRIVWDLTNFRYPVEDARQLRGEIMSDPMMRELIESDGSLELAHSATATREDLQMWSEIKEVFYQAVKQR